MCSASFVRSLIHNPLEGYNYIKNKFNSNTPALVSFEEIGSTVNFLISSLNKDNISQFCKKCSFAERIKHNALLSLKQVQISFVTTPLKGLKYPHIPHILGSYPFQPTLNAIEETLNFYDCYTREIYQNMEPNSKEMLLPPLYHTDRYRHYSQSTRHKSDFFTIPTHESLGLIDFIKIRGVPISFVGVNIDPVFNDAYYNSPLDFWVHDWNHSRRLRSYNHLFYEKHNININDGCKYLNSIVENVILPSIVISSSMNSKEIAIRKAMTLLYFEWLHEYAFTPDVNSLIEILNFKPGDPSPFEIMVTENDKDKDIELRRMPNFNIKSGISYFDTNDDNIKVKYFFDRGPNFLSSAYNKLTNWFYDIPTQLNHELPSLEYRTPEIIALAILQIIDLFNIKSSVTYSYDDLIYLIQNKDRSGKVLGPIETYPNKK